MPGLFSFGKEHISWAVCTCMQILFDVGRHTTVQNSHFCWSLFTHFQKKCKSVQDNCYLALEKKVHTICFEKIENFFAFHRMIPTMVTHRTLAFDEHYFIVVPLNMYCSLFLAYLTLSAHVLEIVVSFLSVCL